MNGNNEETVKKLKGRAERAKSEPKSGPDKGEPTPGRQVAPSRSVEKPVTRSIKFDIVDDDTIKGVYLDRFIEASENIRVELRAVTPAWAQNVLDKYNTHNRKMGSHNAARIERVVVEDRWEVNGDTIGFDVDGILTNGQNRLKGIADSGITVPCIIIYGLSKRAFQTLDTQKRRTGSDVLEIEGHTYSNILASTLAWQSAFEAERMTDYDARKIQTDQVLGLLAKYPDIKDSVVWARANSVPKMPLSPSLLAFFHYNLSKIDREDAEKFLISMTEGLGVDEGSHMHLLRRRLSNLASGTKGHTEYVTMAAIVIKTWNRIRRNEPSPGKDGFVSWRNDERFPAIFQG